MNHVYNNVIIFSKSLQKSELKLKEIEDKILESKDEFIVKRIKHMLRTNLRKISIVNANHSARGFRCSWAYIDMDISIRILHEVIYPCMYSCYGGKTLQDSIAYF